MTEPRRFILQAIDPDLGCPVFEAMFVVDRPEQLQALLGEAATDDPDLEMFYTLEPAEVVAVSRQFDVPFEPQGRVTCLYKWTHGREVPYLVHTGYELALLLDGRKQFARMTLEYPPSKHVSEDRFDHYVAQGVLHKEVELEKFDKPHRMKNGRVLEGIRTVYYTRKDEEWRIAAWKLVSKASAKSGWNETFERFEGMLFGYEDWQNDWWIEDLRRRGRRFGTLLVYVPVTSSDLAGIESSGFRALPNLQIPIKLLTDFEEDSNNQELGNLRAAAGVVALAKFRVKARSFLELVGARQQAHHELAPERVKDLNRLIVDEIEIIST